MKGSRMLVCLALVGDLLVAAEPRGLEYHLIAIAGEKAARCGSFRRPPGTRPLFDLSREESRAVSACITAARREKRGFFFTVEVPGVDTTIVGGLVGAPSGAIKRLHYWSGCRPRRDDEPGPGAKCDEVFGAAACPPPKTAGTIDLGMACR